LLCNLYFTSCIYQAKIKETMEKAYWDVVADSLRGDMPDYSHLVNLVKEVKETLHELAPMRWKDEISKNINLEALSQVRVQFVFWDLW
jgi:hypothetical protein